jgi:hypothetical protein
MTYVNPRETEQRYCGAHECDVMSHVTGVYRVYPED